MGERSGRDVAEEQAAGSNGWLGLENRAGLVEGMESIREFVEVVSEKVRPEVIEHNRNRFGILKQFHRQHALGRLGNQNGCLRIGFDPSPAENGADPHVGILEVGRGVALHRQEFVPGEDVVGVAVLRKLGIFHRADADDLRNGLHILFRKGLLPGGDHFARALDRLVKHLGQSNILAGTGLHDFPVFAENAAKRYVGKVRRDPEEPARRKDLLKMQRLRCADDIPDGVRVPPLKSIFNRREIGRRVEKSAITFPDNGRFFG